MKFIKIFVFASLLLSGLSVSNSYMMSSSRSYGDDELIQKFNAAVGKEAVSDDFNLVYNALGRIKNEKLYLALSSFLNSEHNRIRTYISDKLVFAWIKKLDAMRGAEQYSGYLNYINALDGIIQYQFKEFFEREFNDKSNNVFNQIDYAFSYILVNSMYKELVAALKKVSNITQVNQSDIKRLFDLFTMFEKTNALNPTPWLKYRLNSLIPSLEHVNATVWERYFFSSVIKTIENNIQMCKEKFVSIRKAFEQETEKTILKKLDDILKSLSKESKESAADCDTSILSTNMDFITMSFDAKIINNNIATMLKSIFETKCLSARKILNENSPYFTTMARENENKIKEKLKTDISKIIPELVDFDPYFSNLSIDKSFDFKKISNWCDIYNWLYTLPYSYFMEEKVFIPLLTQLVSQLNNNELKLADIIESWQTFHKIFNALKEKGWTFESLNTLVDSISTKEAQAKAEVSAKLKEDAYNLHLQKVYNNINQANELINEAKELNFDKAKKEIKSFIDYSLVGGLQSNYFLKLLDFNSKDKQEIISLISNYLDTCASGNRALVNMSAMKQHFIIFFLAANMLLKEKSDLIKKTLGISQDGDISLRNFSGSIEEIFYTNVIIPDFDTFGELNFNDKNTWDRFYELLLYLPYSWFMQYEVFAQKLLPNIYNKIVSKKLKPVDIREDWEKSYRFFNELNKKGWIFKNSYLIGNMEAVNQLIMQSEKGQKFEGEAKAQPTDKATAQEEQKPQEEKQKRIEPQNAQEALRLYFKIFGLNENATKSDFLHAYNRIAVLIHPDKTEGGSDEHMKTLGTIKGILVYYYDSKAGMADQKDSSLFHDFIRWPKVTQEFEQFIKQRSEEEAKIHEEKRIKEEQRRIKEQKEQQERLIEQQRIEAEKTKIKFEADRKAEEERRAQEARRLGEEKWQKEKVEIEKRIADRIGFIKSIKQQRNRYDPEILPGAVAAIDNAIKRSEREIIDLQNKILEHSGEKH